jgi:hypothetical protein
VASDSGWSLLVYMPNPGAGMGRQAQGETAWINRDSEKSTGINSGRARWSSASKAMASSPSARWNVLNMCGTILPGKYQVKGKNLQYRDEFKGQRGRGTVPCIGAPPRRNAGAPPLKHACEGCGNCAGPRAGCADDLGRPDLDCDGFFNYNWAPPDKNLVRARKA